MKFKTKKLCKWMYKFMKKKKYNEFSEWFKDFELLSSNPDDVKLLKSIETKVLNSDIDIKDQIKDYLIGKRLLGNNPIEGIKDLYESMDLDSFIVVKSEEDPWFTA